MWYSIYATDFENSLDKRLVNRPKHLKRLQLLQENKMVKISGGINKVGKFFVYQSKIREISTFFDGKSMRIYVTPNINFTIV